MSRVEGDAGLEDTLVVPTGPPGAKNTCAMETDPCPPLLALRPALLYKHQPVRLARLV